MKKLPLIEIGFQTFIEGTHEEFGAVRDVVPEGRPELLVYVENSGEFVVPLEAVHAVYEVAQAVKIPIVGQGGIETLSDTLEFFLAGATAISIGTANFTDPRIPERIVAELETYLTRRGLASIDAIVGKANLGFATPHQYEGDEG